MNTPVRRVATGPPNLVVIGASTGGPRVLSYLLSLLPPIRACILIVQHIPKFINASFVKTLSRSSRSEVRLAREGERLEEASIYVAPSGVHCTLVHNLSLSLVAGPSVNYVCPSIDVTMQSIQATPLGSRLIGVLLTGMGCDGAAGLAHLRKLGGLTIAQDQASCAVYGMPAEAVKLGCVDYQLAPARIAQLLVREVGALPMAEESLSHRQNHVRIGPATLGTETTHYSSDFPV